jgi:hypothetical protein
VPCGKKWIVSRNRKDAIIAFAAGAAVELAIMVAMYVVVALPGWTSVLQRLDAVQSAGASMAEQLYPHVGYAASVASGFSLNAGIFGVFILGLIGTYRAVRAS